MIDVWVAELRVSERTRQKIIQKHGINEEDVRDAIVCVEGLKGAWDDDARRGRRAILKTSINGRPALAVLYPETSAFEDTWHLGSVYYVDRY